MGVLLSELQIALNDVVVACLEAADGHEAAAGMLEEDDRLEEAGVPPHDPRRRALAREMAECVDALAGILQAPAVMHGRVIN